MKDDTAVQDETQRLKTRRQIAKQLQISLRSVDRLTADKVIPYIRISPRCVRFKPEDVFDALSRFEIQEAAAH